MSSIFYELNKLKNVCTNTENNIDVGFLNPQDLFTLKSLTDERAREQQLLLNHMKRNVLLLNKVKSNLSDEDKFNSIDSNQLKTEMINLQDGILNLKSNALKRMEELRKLEAAFSEQINCFQQFDIYNETNHKLEENSAEIELESSMNVDKNGASKVNKKFMFTVSKEETKQQLLLWKQNKMIKEAEEVANEVKTKEKLKEDETIKLKKSLDVKSHVEEWKAEKIANIKARQVNDAAKLEMEKLIKSKVANKMIKQYQNQDRNYVDKMREICARNVLESKSGQIQLRNESKRKTMAMAPRDPERLFKPTTQWLNRIGCKSKSSHNINDLSQVTKLTTPTWRKI